MNITDKKFKEKIVVYNINIAAILDDPMECSRGERLAITLAKDSINRSSNRSTTGKLEVDIFELLRDSEYETGETMCQIMSKGVVAVLGPSASPASNSIISNICGEKEVSAGSFSCIQNCAAAIMYY
ncbi:glutamate receptor ionotropic, kainate 4-like [Tachysurus ichikawai]